MNVNELEVYKNGMLILEYIYKMDFPSEEKYMLRSQMIRAAQSILLNIGEARAFRDKRNEHHLSISLGSAKECLVCCDIYNKFIGQCPVEIIAALEKECGMLSSMIKLNQV